MIAMNTLIKNHSYQEIILIIVRDELMKIISLNSIYDILFANITKSDDEDE
jgi:hypothetical protein